MLLSVDRRARACRYPAPESLMILETNYIYHISDYIRLVQEIQPTAFVIENVPGLVGLFGGQIKDSIIEKFISMGYTIQYKILCAADYGVTQKRERVIIVGFRKDLHIDFTFPDVIYSQEDLYQPLSSVLEKNVDEKYFFSEKAVQGMMKNRESMNKGRAQDITKPCNTVGAHLAKVSLNSTDSVLMEGERYRRFTPREVARIQSFPEKFKLVGSKSAQYRALGNAIPPVMFWYVANSVFKELVAE